MSVLDELRGYMAETEDLRRIAEHLFLDQQTIMPKAAISDRARQVGLIEARMHERLASDRFGDLIAQAEQEGEDVEWLAAARRDFDRETKRPEELQRAFSEVGLLAGAEWERARAESDWSRFAPWLARMVGINLQVADAMGATDAPHDALLSLYEPGPTTAEIDAIFDSLRGDLVRLAREREVRSEPESAVVSTETVLQIGHDIGELVGFDFSRGTLAISPHGYTNPGGPNDIRVTFRDDRPIAATIGTMLHEFGHGLYEQGIDEALWGTAAGRGIMPYLHESQSKYWENIIGRRADLMPVLVDIIRQRAGSEAAPTADELFTVQTRSPSSLIRTESDEVTFNLHIMLRWEIERGLLSGSLDVGEVPELWNERSREYFGRTPVNDAEGALQDPHWCRRYMGLFTSYVVGNIASAQMAAAQQSDGVSIEQAVAARDFTAPLGWLRRNVHAVGRARSMHDVLTAATGSRLDPEPYRAHLIARYGH